MPDLVGAAEVAELLGVSKQHVHRLAKRPDFPTPIEVLSAGKIWRRSDIEKWAKTHPDRRPGRPEKPWPHDPK